MQDLIQKTKAVRNNFPNQMGKQAMLIDLMEEVGELAQAVLITEKIKKTNDPAKQRDKSDIADALCDILYDLITIADQYGLDLNKEYSDMLDRLQSRLDSGEFS